MSRKGEIAVRTLPRPQCASLVTKVVMRHPEMPRWGRGEVPHDARCLQSTTSKSCCSERFNQARKYLNSGVHVSGKGEGREERDEEGEERLSSIEGQHQR
jgi:hypothetical protein